MKTVGQQLQEARLAKNWTPELAARETKIKVDRVRDLEADDYTHFSSPAYARGFVRTYARSLGLDEYKILRLLDNKLPEDDNASFAPDSGMPYVPEPSQTMHVSSAPRTGLYVVLGLFCAVVIIISFVLLQAYRAGELPRYFASTANSDNTISSASTNQAPIADAEAPAHALPVDPNDTSHSVRALPVDTTTLAAPAAPAESNAAPAAPMSGAPPVAGTQPPAAAPAVAATQAPVVAAAPVEAQPPVAVSSPSTDAAPEAAAVTNAAPAAVAVNNSVAPLSTPAPTVNAPPPAVVPAPDATAPVVAAPNPPPVNAPAAAPAPEATTNVGPILVAAAPSATATVPSAPAPPASDVPATTSVPLPAATNMPTATSAPVPTVDDAPVPAAPPTAANESSKATRPVKAPPRALPVSASELAADEASTGAAASPVPMPATDENSTVVDLGASAASTPPPGKRLVLTASRDSFIRVTSLDGGGSNGVLYAKVLHQGQSLSFNGHKFSVDVGVPSAVDIMLDGVNYGPHSDSGSPETFTLESHEP